jgi:hypothetical protein
MLPKRMMAAHQRIGARKVAGPQRREVASSHRELDLNGRLRISKVQDKVRRLMFSPLYFTLILAGIILIACAFLGSLYLTCRHSGPDEEKPRKRINVSNLK